MIEPPLRTSTYERPFTQEGNYLVYLLVFCERPQHSFACQACEKIVLKLTEMEGDISADRFGDSH